MTPTDKNWIVSDFAGALASASESAGARVTDRIKTEISVAYPPASKPGTPPHRRTGNLQNKTRHTVVTEVNAGQVRLIVENAAPYGGYLRDGTSRMEARDFMGDAAADRYTDIVVDAIVDSLKDSFT